MAAAQPISGLSPSDRELHDAARNGNEQDLNYLLDGSGPHCDSVSQAENGIDMGRLPPRSENTCSSEGNHYVEAMAKAFVEAAERHDSDRMYSILGRVGREVLLHYAAQHGRDRVLRHLLDVQGLNVNAQDEMGYSALILAARQGHTVCVRLLLHKGADVLIATRDNFTCLHMAAFCGYVEVVNLLLHGKSPRECWDEWDPSIPFLSCRDRRALMDRKSSSESFTALHLAAIGVRADGSEVDIAASLLEAYRTSVLEIYGLARNPKVNYSIDNELWLDYLLQIRNNLNLEDGDSSPEAILKSLASYGNLNGLVLQEKLLEKYEGLVRSYVELVSYSNARDRIGRTALHYAAWKKMARLVEFLTWDTKLGGSQDPQLGSVANVNARDVDGYTPLHLASRNGSTDVAIALHRFNGVAKDKLGPRQELLDKKIYLQPNPAARPNHHSRCIAKETLAALHKLGHQHVQNGCDLENFAWVENRADVTPLHYAVEKGHMEIVKLLVEHPKIDVFHSNSNGQSPWTIAFPPHLRLLQLRDDNKIGIRRLLRSGTMTSFPKGEEFAKHRSYRQQLLKKAAALAVEVDREEDSRIDAASQLLILEIQIFLTFLENITGGSGPDCDEKSTSTRDKNLQLIDPVERNYGNGSWEEVMESYFLSITSRPMESLSLLHVAAFEGCDEELETLMKLKKYKNCINDCEDITSSGYTALHFAVMECKADRRALKVLLNEKTLNPAKRNKEGQTPLQVVDHEQDGEKLPLSITRFLTSVEGSISKFLANCKPDHDQVVHGLYVLQLLNSILWALVVQSQVCLLQLKPLIWASAKRLLWGRPEVQKFPNLQSDCLGLLVGARQLLMGHPEVEQFLDGLHKERQRSATAATSFMVCAALLATISFNGWLQPPPVYAGDFQTLFPSGASSADSPASFGPNSRRALIYWGLNSISFVSALGAMLTAISAAVPPRSSYSDREMDVLYVKKRLRVTSIYLGVSIYCVLAAFAAATRTGASVTPDSRGELVAYFVIVVAALVFFWALAGFFLRLFGLLGTATSKPLIAIARITYIVIVAGCFVWFIEFTSPAIYNRI